MQPTLTEELLEEFLESSERCIVDFKSTIYDVTDENSKISFIKDILSMSNTERSQSAFIIIGVSENGAHKSFTGVDENIDDNNFQTIIKSCIEPTAPQFLYYTFKYKKGKCTLGVFEIPISGSEPFYSNRDFLHKIEKGKIYYRQGTSNSVANEKKVAEISRWMMGYGSDEWRNIMRYSYDFDYKQFNYILVYGPQNPLSKQLLKSISFIKWSCIIDMSNGSEQNGLYQINQDSLKKKGALHLITTSVKEIPNFYENNTLFWVHAGGEQDISIPALSRRDWNKIYSSYVRKCLQIIKNNSTKPVIVITLLNNMEYEQTLDDIVQSSFLDGYRDRHIILNLSDEEAIEVVEENYVSISVTSFDVFNCLCQTCNYSNGVEGYLLPTQDGSNKAIENVTWLEEELTVLFKHIELTLEHAKNYSPDQFYKGHLLQWDEMNPAKDVLRTISRELVDKIKSSLQNYPTNNMIEFAYQAGTGVSTLVRRLAWELHDNCPVILINRFSNSTYDRIAYISEETGMPIAIFIDSIFVTIIDAYELKRKLDANSIRYSLFITKRYIHERPINPKYQLPETLDISENHSFYKKYSELIDHEEISFKAKELRKQALKNISTGIISNQTPFIYSLAAFEDDFLSLEKYVRDRISGCSEDQRKILLALSIAYYYGSFSLPELILSKYYNTVGRFKMENILAKGQMNLVVNEDGKFRPLHYCVAKEMLIQLCQRESMDRQAWKNNLKDAFVFFIDLLGKECFTENRFVLEMIKVIFFDRDNNETFQEKFSNAISDLPSKEAKKEVLQKLVDCFPYNAHAHGHLSRFYNYILKEYESAISEINIAIKLAPLDYNLHHIKGSCLKHELIENITTNWGKLYTDTNKIIEMIIRSAKEAESCFKESKSINPTNMYAYESLIYLYTDVIKKYRETFYSEMNYSEILEQAKNSWCSNFIDDAKEILREAQRIKFDMNTEFRKKKCTAVIEEVTGNISLAIQSWIKLLDKSEVYHPPIRRNIVYAYKTMGGNNWSNVPIQERAKALDLLERNIEQECENRVNIFIWIELIRKIPSMNNQIDKVIERLQYWSNEGDTLVSYFYSYTFYAVRAIKNRSKLDAQQSVLIQSKCSNLAMNIPKRKYAKEWYDSLKEGLASIIENQELREYYPELEFDNRISKLGHIEGRIIDIEREDSGTIEIESCGLRVQFNPGHNYKEKFYKGRDTGILVSFKLAFTYDGLRAYQVEKVQV